MPHKELLCHRFLCINEQLFQMLLHVGLTGRIPAHIYTHISTKQKQEDLHIKNFGELWNFHQNSVCGSKNRSVNRRMRTEAGWCRQSVGTNSLISSEWALVPPSLSLFITASAFQPDAICFCCLVSQSEEASWWLKVQKRRAHDKVVYEFRAQSHISSSSPVN